MTAQPPPKPGKYSLAQKLAHHAFTVLVLARFALDVGGFVDELRAGGVETIHTQEATLDRVFVAVTGRSLTSDGAW